MDAVEIGRNRSLWQPVSRGVAVTESRSRTVAVIHRTSGRNTVSLFQPSNRFFLSNGPYLYDGLRYFLYMGAGGQTLQGVGKSLGLTNKPPEAELEPLEFEDPATGEFRSLGSPTAKAPKGPTPPKPPTLPNDLKPPSVPEIPKPPSLPELPQLPGIPDFPTLQEFAIPKVPEIPSVPEMPQAPDLPAIPEIPALPEIPTLPVLPIDLSSDPLIPIEYRLVDGKGKPMQPMAFRITLPDGTFKTGTSDADGFIKVPDNRQKGQAKLELLDPDESDPETIAAFLSPPPKGKHPIAIKLTDAEENILPRTAFRIKLPDGEIKEGESDAEGFIRFPDNEQTGELELVLTDFAEQGA